MAADINNSFANLLRRFTELPMGQKLGLMVTAAGLIALLAGTVMWSRQPEYRVLYSNLSDRDGGLIIASLTQMNIPYRFTEGSGAILVPDDKVHEARLRLASQGLPKGSVVGFEVMENQKLGVTQFQEQVNYQRALEGELAKSVQALAAVQSARVHLAIPKPTVFLRDQQKPSASVLVNLYPGRSLERAQVSGIMHLVASSVADLPVKSVSILDQDGNLLSENADSRAGAHLDASQLAYLHQTEQSYINRVLDILEPIVGRENVRAQVTADLDFSQTESTAESYKPNGSPVNATIRSQQTSETTNGAGATAQGIPGALSNQPPGAATAPITGQAGANASPQQASTPMRKDATINYEVDKTVKFTRNPVGSIKRLSAAVVVNYRKSTDKSGQAVVSAFSAQELDQIKALVREAMGFNESRGDSLNVVNTPFNAEEEKPQPEVSLWKRPETLALAKEIGKNVLIALLIFYIVFGVLRPALRRLATPRELPPAALPSAIGAVDVNGGAVVTINPLETARQLARQDPKMIATVVKSWVSANE